MTIIRLLCVMMLLGLSPAVSAQGRNKTVNPRVFFHSRGESVDQPFLEVWKEGDKTYFTDAKSGKSFSFLHESIIETSNRPPALTSDWKGSLKFRNGAWWFLRFERGSHPEDRVSSLFRYDPTSKAWNLLNQLDIRASNFELLGDDRILLFGIFQPAKKKYFLGGVLSGTSPSIDLLDETPIKKQFPELFWKSCLTSIDSQMAYAYFPLSGHLYGYDLQSRSLKEFRVPWSLLSDESIGKEIEAAKVAGKQDCFISAVGHPGASNCYFLPMPGGQMAFIYKVLDEEEEKRMAFSDGTRPVIEWVSSIMLIPDEPRFMIELTPPSRKSLERWCWSSTAGRLVRWEDLRVPDKKSPAKPTRKVPGVVM